VRLIIYFSIFRFLYCPIDQYIHILCVLLSNKGAVAVRQPYVRVVGIEDANEAKSRGPTAFTTEEVSVDQL
jgi:hypothetical protein